MRIVNCNNVNDAYYQGVAFFLEPTAKLDRVVTRGQVRLTYRGAWATEYQRPLERVLFDSIRDANPFFHLMDALYMLAGCDDVPRLAYWLPKVAEYSDDGRTFHGAYGARMQHNDQLFHVIQRLRKDRHSSRAVLALYWPDDADYQGKDMPCNCTVMFDIKNDRLCMSVANRSNDMIWGAYGANAVQFSILQEFVAASLDVEVGTYTQFSHNTHVYPETEVWQRIAKYGPRLPESDVEYADCLVVPLVHRKDFFLRDLTEFINQPWAFCHANGAPYANEFFPYVAAPMMASYQAHREGNREKRDRMLRFMPQSNDWHRAAQAWYGRRDRHAAR